LLGAATHSLAVGTVLLLLAVSEGVTGWLVSRRVPDPQRRRILVLAFGTSAALMFGLGLAMLLGGWSLGG